MLKNLVYMVVWPMPSSYVLCSCRGWPSCEHRRRWISSWSLSDCSKVCGRITLTSSVCSTRAPVRSRQTSLARASALISVLWTTSPTPSSDTTRTTSSTASDRYTFPTILQVLTCFQKNCNYLNFLLVCLVSSSIKRITEVMSGSTNIFLIINIFPCWQGWNTL